MTTQKRKKAWSITVVVTLMLELCTVRLLGETTDGLGQLPKAEPTQDVQLPELPKLEAPPPQPPQQPDRANKNGAAKALAAVGAAMAMMSCMMLMKKAQEARQRGDNDMADLLMMQAMQQCAQGAKDMADAAKNDEGRKQLTQNDTPKMAQLSAPAFKAPTQSGSKESTPNLNTGTAASDDDDDDRGVIPPTSQVEVPEFKVPQQSPDGEQPITVPGNPAESVTTLSPIDQAKLRFDEGSKGGAATPVPGFIGPSTFSVASTRVLTPEELKRLAEQAKEKETKTGKKSGSGGRAEEASFSGSSAGDSGSSSKSSDPFEGMLSQLLGGPTLPGEGQAGNGSDVLIIDRSNQDPSKPALNIFQYASYRYQVLTHEETKISPKIATQNSPATQSRTRPLTIAREGSAH